MRGLCSLLGTMAHSHPLSYPGALKIEALLLDVVIVGACGRHCMIYSIVRVIYEYATMFDTNLVLLNIVTHSTGVMCLAGSKALSRGTVSSPTWTTL